MFSGRPLPQTPEGPRGHDAKTSRRRRSSRQRAAQTQPLRRDSGGLTVENACTIIIIILIIYIAQAGIMKEINAQEQHNSKEEGDKPGDDDA